MSKFQPNRRSMLKKSTTAMGALALGSVFAGNAQTKTSGSFVHIVLFWLKEPDNAAHQKTFEANCKQLMKIDLIRSRHLGKAAGTDRSVVDNSYSYCMIVSFDNKADQDTYQTHPDHLKFIDDTAALWEKVQVYDTIKL